ncbi:MAG TPA: potassium transporter TrkG, partial [Paracoccaceae bacterium]|nr:potassium transporter TrkG [Paracoccaceae bacterium]
MLDLRPVGFVIGYLVMALGATMLLPLGAEIIMGGRDAQTFVFSTIVTVMTGGLLVLACQSSNINRINIQQTFIVTTLSWLVLPFFGAIPFWIGSLNANFTASFFESMSGLTTTGSSNFTNLNDMSPGLLFWRSLLQWIGGVGIVVVAMVFLPTLRVGGMQIFRSEGFDTLGKILPRAAEIAKSISYIYLGITIACIFSYLLVGMTMFEALNHAFTTVSTGGFSTYDASFGTFSGLPEYVASFFMILASLPFVRYVQLIAGTAKPLLRDSQIQTYLAAIMIFALVLVLYRLTFSGDGGEEAFREAVFNVTSIMSGTGYASVDYNHWGSFPIALFFIIG